MTGQNRFSRRAPSFSREQTSRPVLFWWWENPRSVVHRGYGKRLRSVPTPPWFFPFPTRHHGMVKAVSRYALPSILLRFHGTSCQWNAESRPILREVYDNLRCTAFGQFPIVSHVPCTKKREICTVFCPLMPTGIVRTNSSS